MEAKVEYLNRDTGSFQVFKFNTSPSMHSKKNGTTIEKYGHNLRERKIDVREKIRVWIALFVDPIVAL